MYDHTIRITESVDTTRDLLAGVLETYLSQTSNRMNKVMKQLSIVATIALPLIVIGGIYGMNFSAMPLTHNPFGFYIALASRWGPSRGRPRLAPQESMALTLSTETITLHTTATPLSLRAGGEARTSVVWVRLADADGAEGWGEADPVVLLRREPDTVLAALPTVARAPSRDPFELEAAEARLAQVLPTNGAARAALSGALHDLVGKRLGQPLWRLWGLDPSARPSRPSPSASTRLKGCARRCGRPQPYPILKIKLGHRSRRRDLSRPSATATDKPIRVDANAGWTRERAHRDDPAS